MARTTENRDRRCPAARRLLAPLALALALAPAAAPARAGRAGIPASPRGIFEPMGAEVGLASRMVTSMLQDEAGFVWIATIDGLFRFDGIEYRRFSEADGLSSTNVSQIAAAADGTIWASAGGAVARFDGRRFRGFALPDGAATAREDADVRQRIAAARDAVYVINGSEVCAIEGRPPAVARRWSKRDGLPGTPILGIVAARDGRIWLVAQRWVGRLDPAAGRVEPVAADGLPEEEALSIHVDGGGTVWVRTENSLARLAPGADRFVDDDEGLAEAPYQGSPSLDRDGELIVPSRAGLFIRRGGGWRKLTDRDGLPGANATAAFEDRDGVLWVGFGGAGLYRWSWRSAWLAWTASEGLPGDGAWDVMRDPKGRLWVGSDDGLGVWLPEERRWKVIRHEDGLVAYNVWKFAIGPDGWVWALSRRTGFTRFDPETLEPEAVAIPGELGRAPWDVAADRDGTLLVGGKGYLLRIGDSAAGLTFESVPLPGEWEGTINSLSVGPDGVLWAGGTGGVLRFDGSWRLLGVEDGLLSCQVMNVAAVSAGEAWISYSEEKGITRLALAGDEVRATHLGRADGLISDMAWLLERDPLGRLWIGGSDGVSVLLPDGAIRSYDQSDGLVWPDISQGGFWMEPDGSVFIGTGRGLAYYDPRAAQPAEAPPGVVLTSTALGGVERLGERGSEVAHDQGVFTARFSGLTFRKAAQAAFEVQLEGLDPEPIATRQREVRYAALPAGAYRFVVRCRSAAGVWSAAPAVFEFVVLPPWWERWWVRIGAVLLAGLGILALVQLRVRRIEKERQRLERAVAERSAQLAEANRELREMSLTDALTRVRNRRYFANAIEGEVAGALRRYDPRSARPADANRDLIFFLVDIDHFKKVNDLHGHSVGDRVLVETARRLQRCVRDSDVVIRWGGEEFLLLCREAERGKAAAVAARVLEAIGGAPLVEGPGLCVHRSCSVGWAALPAHPARPDALGYEEIVEIADKALYLAKASGRNRAVGAELTDAGLELVAQTGWRERPLAELDPAAFRLVRVAGPEARPSDRPPPPA